MEKKVIYVARQTKAKEARLWITQVLFPVTIGAAFISTTPLGRKIGGCLSSAGSKIKCGFSKISQKIHVKNDKNM